MAIMIPNSIGKTTPSPAEREIFAKFQSCPGTDGWYVIHSLHLDRHITQTEGEIDFVVLAPGYGLFVLEVKGGEVSRDEYGQWHYRTRGGRDLDKNTSPFRQAETGMFSLVDWLRSNIGEAHERLKHVFYTYGVMFPDVSFPKNGVEDDDARIYDISSEGTVRDYIIRLFNYQSGKLAKEPYGPVVVRPDKEEVGYIANKLRGPFDAKVPLSRSIGETESEQKGFTEEQKRYLALCRWNDRILVQGAAGTGKTMLAIQEASDASWESIDVGFFCYNIALGSWLSGIFDGNVLHRPKSVGAFLSFLQHLIARREPDFPMQGNDDYWHRVLPEKALEWIREEDRFDMLVLDECQDLFTPEWLEVLDRLLRGGLSGGRWAMFGDFGMQAIFAQGEGEKDLVGNLRAFCPYWTNLKLEMNCRNTKQIWDASLTASGIALSSVETLSEGEEVDRIVYADGDDEEKRLRDLLGRLAEEGIPDGEITVLSPCKRDRSVAGRFSPDEIAPWSEGRKDVPSWSTIQGFKGLENSVIIITDIQTYSMFRNVIFVGYTRARSKLYVFHTAEAEEEFEAFAANRTGWKD